MPPVRRHQEQLQLVAVSGGGGRLRRTAPQWQEPRSGGDVIALDARSLVVLRDHEDDTPETDHSVAASLAALTTPIDLVPAQAPTVELPH